MNSKDCCFRDGGYVLNIVCLSQRTERGGGVEGMQRVLNNRGVREKKERGADMIMRGGACRAFLRLWKVERWSIMGKAPK